MKQDVIVGEIVVSGSVDQTMKMWDANSGFCQRTIDDHMDVITIIKIYVRHRHFYFIVVFIKEALYKIQILCRRYTFWSYSAGLTIADPPG